MRSVAPHDRRLSGHACGGHARRTICRILIYVSGCRWLPPKARAAHAGPHSAKQADQDGSYVKLARCGGQSSAARPAVCPARGHRVQVGYLGMPPAPIGGTDLGSGVYSPEAVTISGRGTHRVGSIRSTRGRGGMAASTNVWYRRVAPVAAVAFGLFTLAVGLASVPLDEMAHQPGPKGPFSFALSPRS